ncbi:MAG: TonB-dependent receptor [Bdellovibrionales bacterium]|nr:TonB-dependent receptor [Bdellovibrionales bacterium]
MKHKIWKCVFAYFFALNIEVITIETVLASEVQDIWIEPEGVDGFEEVGYRSVLTHPPDKSQSLAHVLAKDSSIVISSVGGDGKNLSLFFRGLGGSHILVLVNGLPLYDASHPSSSFDWSNEDTQDVLYVEVFTGPKSLTFGPNAMAGVVNIVTVDPLSVFSETKKFSLQVKNYGSVGGAWQNPILFSNWSSLLNLRVRKSDGPSVSDGGVEEDSYKNLTGSWRGLSQWTNDRGEKENIFIYFKNINQENDLDKNGGSLGDDPNYTETSRHQILQIHKSRDSSDARVHDQISLHYSQSARSNLNEIDEHSAQSLSAELKSESIGLKWSSAVKTSNVSSYEYGVHGIYDQAKSFYYLDGTDYSFADKSKLYMGTYYFWQNSFVKVSVRLGKFDQSEPQLDGQWSLFKRNNAYKIWITSGTASQTPSLYQLYDQQYGNSQLKPEKANFIETGVSYSQGSYMSQWMVYCYDVQDLISADSNFKASNIENSKILGTEWSQLLRYRFINIKLSWSYTDARKSSNQSLLLKRPFNKINMSTEYKFDEDEWVNYSIMYLGERQEYDDEINQIVTAPSWFEHSLLWNFRTKNNDQWSVSVSNILNHHHQYIPGYNTGGRQISLKWLTEY